MIAGITGGIGAGKSTVANLLKIYDIPVYNSDLRAKYLMNENTTIISKMKNHFGNLIYNNNILDRSKLAEIIFSDSNELKWVNKLVHPIVRVDFSNWIYLHKLSPLLVHESAILIESGAYNQVDTTLLIASPIEVRIKRVMNRDKCSRKNVLDRINNQLSDEEKRKYSNFIIYSDDIRFIVPQVHEWLNFCGIRNLKIN